MMAGILNTATIRRLKKIITLLDDGLVFIQIDGGGFNITLFFEA
jgi:hypothetical protein